MTNLQMIQAHLPTTMPAWIVLAWPRVLWQARSHTQLQFVHLGTRVVSAGEHGAACVGQTLWGGSSEDGAAGVAWDWVELQRGVVAMADPMGLITNLTLLDETGEPIPSQQAALHLNEIVHALPWQCEVTRALAHNG